MGCNVSKDVKVDDQGNAENQKEGGNTMSEEKAAEKIQASFRGYKTRKSLKNNGVLPHEEKIDDKSKKSTECADVKNSPNPTPASEADETLDIDLTDKDLEKAAYKIQASYRNFTKKKTPQVEPKIEQEVIESVKEQSEECQKSTEQEPNLEDPEVAKAALKIQSTYRGYKVRKEVNTETSQNSDE